MEKKKSYLSKQMIAAIVIATVVAVALPVYFFLLKPLIEKENTPEAGPTVLEPLLAGEKHAGLNSRYERGGSVFLFSAEIGDDTVFDIKAKEGNWSFTSRNGNLFVNGYESITISSALFNLYSSMRAPLGVHIAPAREKLLELRAEKAAKMSEKELEEIGGLNNVVLTNEDLEKIDVDFAEYGLVDTAAADRFTFKDKEGGERTVYLGDYTVNGSERYARVEGTKAVYKLTPTMTDLFSLGLWDAMSAIVTDVTGDAATGGYVPDKFTIVRDGVTYVDIRRFDPEDALAMDRMTTSLLVRSYKNAEDETIVNYYDTSSDYSTMLYQYFREGIFGTKVLAAAKSVMITVGDVTGPAHGEFSDEEFAQFGIDIDKPHRVLFTAKYYTDEEPDEEGNLPALVNYLVFSEPYTLDGVEYYNVYNTNRATIMRVKKSAVPFIEEDEEFFVGRYVSVQQMEAVDTFSVDASNLPDFMLEDGVTKLKESFKIDYLLHGKERVRDDKYRYTINGIVLSDGSKAPDVSDGTVASENFRNFYFHFGKIKLYTNVERYLSKIEKIDLENEGMSITYSVYGKDRAHTMKFYFFDEAGIWAFYTVDGEGRYICRTEDVKTVLKGLLLVRNGESVVNALGEPG